MEKEEFLEVAPRYYALAVVYHFGRNYNTTTRNEIVDEFSFQGDSSDPNDRVYLLADGKLLDKALEILVGEGLIEVELDHFGPALIHPSDDFSQLWSNLTKTNGVYGRYERVGHNSKQSWLRQALQNLALEERRLGIEDRDYDESEDEWRPIPVEHTAEVQSVIDAIEDAAEKIRSDNGYTATRPEEAKLVVDSLKTFTGRMREFATVSIPYIRRYAVDPLWRAAKVLGRNVAGIAIEAAKARLKAWLMKAGIPWPFDWF